MTSVLPTIIVASGVGLALVAATDLRATDSVATERPRRRRSCATSIPC